MKKTRENLEAMIRKNPTLTSDKLAAMTGYSSSHVRETKREMGIVSVTEVADERKTLGEKKENQGYKAKYLKLLDDIKKAEEERDAVKAMTRISTFNISLPKDKSKSGATAVVLASDWHSEERVDPDTVNGFNEFNMDIEEKRATAFFQNVVKILKIRQMNSDIKTMVFALLGDFISGSIHDELMEGNQLLPIEALIRVQNQIASGIEFILKETDVDLIIPCHSGNHGRSTQRQRIATERGNSFEYYMYHQLANYFAGEKRVKFLVAGGYLSYVDIGDFTIRFHHGHAIRYYGGVGGIFIPARKAVAQWNKMRRADLDCFGHFHQSKFDTGNFVCNGSLIGFNAYAVNIKCDPEPPAQTFFLVNHKRRQVSDYCPVWLS